MSSLLAYSGLATKIRAMKSNLIREEEYREIASFHSVPEVVSFLKRHSAYNEEFQNMDDASLHRGQVEMHLHHTLYKDFSKIYRFSNIKQRSFLSLYFTKYEVSLLKNCFRTIFNKNTVQLNQIGDPTLFENHFSFPVMKLNDSSSTEELIQNLKGSVYYEQLWVVLNNAGSTLFDYETALDMLYFKASWKTLHKYFSGKELSILSENFGSKIDMLNIQWIYRSKKYYKMTPADIYALIIPIQYKLKKEEITAMAESESIEALADAIRASYYGRHFQEASPSSLEKMYRSILNKIHQAAVRKYPYSVACVHSYLYSKENEVYKLTTALEGIRYGLSQDEIVGYIL